MDEQIDKIEELTDSEDSDSETKEDECRLGSKSIFKELPDSSSGKYLYKMDTKAAREELESVWKDPEAKKETLSKLEKIEKGELTRRHQKSLQGFKKLKEYKFNKIRIIIEPGKKGAPEQIVGIVKRPRLKELMKTFQNKYNKN